MDQVARETERVVTPCEEQPELFFPEGYLGKQLEGDVGLPDYHSEESIAARALCAGCPFFAECLDLAVSIMPEYGIFAGLDPDEIAREAVKRELHREGV